MFSYSTGYYVSPPDDQYLKFKNRCSLLRILQEGSAPGVTATEAMLEPPAARCARAEEAAPVDVMLEADTAAEAVSQPRGVNPGGNEETAVRGAAAAPAAAATSGALTSGQG